MYVLNCRSVRPTSSAAPSSISMPVTLGAKPVRAGARSLRSDSATLNAHVPRAS